MQLTKHCRPADRARMLEGHFKLGTLGEYRSGEKTIGTYGDFEEGSSLTEIKGDLVDFTGSIGNLHLRNCSSVGNIGSAISFRSTTNLHVLCLSRGSYRAERHLSLLRGNGAYAANPEITAHLTLDGKKLGHALTELCKEIGGLKWEHGRIEYGSRTFVGRAATAQQDLSPEKLSKQQHRVIFIKPPLFRVEEEHRFAIYGDNPTTVNDPILTINLSQQVQSLFKAAICDEGADTLTRSR